MESILLLKSGIAEPKVDFMLPKKTSAFHYTIQMTSNLKLLRVSKAVNEADLADLSLIEAVCSEIQEKSREKGQENGERSRTVEKQQNRENSVQINHIDGIKDVAKLKSGCMEVDENLLTSTIVEPIRHRLPVINVIPYQGFPGTIQDALEVACQIYASQYPDIVQKITNEASSVEQQSAHEVLQRRKLFELSVWRKETMKVVGSNISKRISNSCNSWHK